MQDKGLNQLTERIRQECGLPNLYVTVVFNGRIYASAAGFQDPTRSRPATTRDRYKIGSVTKPLTSLLTLRLAASGKLKLDDTIVQHFPEAAQSANPQFLKATVQNLLTHTSGLSRPGTGPHRSRRQNEASESFGTAARLECVPKWLAEKPAADLGQYSYSNNGYCILGALCEKVGKASYAALMKSEVFGPLGMIGAAVGMPSQEGNPDHPWQFPLKDGVSEEPFPSTSKHDQGPTAEPQGGIYWDSESAGRLILEMIRMSRGTSSYLPRELSKGVLTPQLGLPSRTWAWESWQEGRFGIALNHNGANADNRGLWNFTHTRVLPGAGFGMSVTTTAGYTGDFIKQCSRLQAFVLGAP